MLENTPSFPKRRIPPNMDGFAVAPNAPSSWETTYNSDTKPKKISSDLYGHAEVDTHKLQSTHWTTGNENEPMLTEHQEKYQKYNADFPQPARTRDQLMKSSFVLGDGSPMETRASLGAQKSIPFDPNRPREGMHDELVMSHIDLGTGTGDKWETTSQASYKAFNSAAPSIINRNLQAGEGAREAIRNDLVASNYQTENKSNYVDYKSRPDAIDQQERLTRFRTSQIQIGDKNANYYQTTNQHDFKELPVHPVDQKFQKEARERLSRSQIYDGKKAPMTTQSSYNETFREYKGFKPPQPSERSAFVSHHDFRDCRETFQSESKSSYVAHPISQTKQVDLHLTNTHIAIGAPGYGEMRSLYNDTFKGEQTKDQRIDPAEVRMFNTGHHSKVNDDTEKPQMITTSQATYVHHKNFRPRSPVEFSNIEHVIAPSDPSLTIRESETRAAYVHHKNAVANRPINNSLQQSHINIAGGNPDQWSTTQQDYFKFKTYKFD